VDEPQRWSKRVGLTRAKAAIVCLLAVAMVAVIYIQYGPTIASEMSTGLARTIRARRAPRPDSAPDSKSENSLPPESGAGGWPSAAVDPSAWRSPGLAAVLAFDPFALPSGFPRPAQATGDSRSAHDPAVAAEDAELAADQLTDAIESLRMELEELQQRGVRVIIRGRDQYAAMIGDRTIHVGDEISGFTVTAIEPDHVLVERKVQR